MQKKLPKAAKAENDRACRGQDASDNLGSYLTFYGRSGEGAAYDGRSVLQLTSRQGRALHPASLVPLGLVLTATRPKVELSSCKDRGRPASSCQGLSLRDLATIQRP